MERKLSGESRFTKAVERTLQAAIPVRSYANHDDYSCTAVISDVKTIEIVGNPEDKSTSFILCEHGIPKSILEANENNLVKDLQLFSFI